jgi:hypothetical protein
MVVNLASPTTLHFSHVIEVGGIALPWGERLTQATAIPSRWPPLPDYLIGLSCAVSVYALWTQRGQVSEGDSFWGSRKPIEAGLAILIATVVVELLDPRRVSALPVDEFGLLAFVILVGLGFAITREPTTRPAPPARG